MNDNEYIYPGFLGNKYVPLMYFSIDEETIFANKYS